MEADTLIIEQGLVLMAAGMSIVFVFLYLLVLVMRLTALVVPRFKHLLPDVAPKVAPKAPSAKKDETTIAVAIAAAVAWTR